MDKVNNSFVLTIIFVRRVTTHDDADDSNAVDGMSSISMQRKTDIARRHGQASVVTIERRATNATGD